MSVKKPKLKSLRPKGFNIEKFKQIVHYIIHKTSEYPNVGKTVLYNLLYFNDFDFYELYEKKITGEVYANIEHGPAPRHFIEVADELIQEGKIQQIESRYYGRTQARYRSISQPDLSLLDATELTHIEQVICKYGSMNATQIEAFSHQDTPWKATKNNENIDYELVFYRDPITAVRVYADD